jgi:hypothetical protein
LLKAITEESEANFMKYIPEFMNDVMDPKNKKNATSEQLTKGVDKFMVLLSDFSVDAPHLPHAIFATMVKPLLEKQMLSIKNMEWCDKNADEIYANEGHFKFFLYLLQWQAE